MCKDWERSIPSILWFVPKVETTQSTTAISLSLCTVFTFSVLTKKHPVFEPTSVQPIEMDSKFNYLFLIIEILHKHQLGLQLAHDPEHSTDRLDTNFVTA